MSPAGRGAGVASARRPDSSRTARSTLLVVFALLGAACGTPSPPDGGAQAPSPPALSEVAPSAVPSPVAAATSVPSPEAKPSPSVADAPDAEGADSGRVRVANTEGQGANLRSEPNPNAPRLRGIPEGTELEVAGPDREAEGRRWRNVRDPADGASGWIVAEFLVALPPTPAPARAAAPGPASPVPARPSPAAAGAPAGTARRIDQADTAYIESLRPQVDAFGKAMTAANQQMEVVGGRPSTVEDPGWRAETLAAARSLADSANGIRATRPGPNTGRVHEHALRAADRIEEAARLLGQAVDARDARAFGPVRTALLRALSEINAMTGATLELET